MNELAWKILPQGVHEYFLMYPHVERSTTSTGFSRRKSETRFDSDSLPPCGKHAKQMVTAAAVRFACKRYRASELWQGALRHATSPMHAVRQRTASTPGAGPCAARCLAKDTCSCCSPDDSFATTSKASSLWVIACTVLWIRWRKLEQQACSTNCSAPTYRRCM